MIISLQKTFSWTCSTTLMMSWWLMTGSQADSITFGNRVSIPYTRVTNFQHIRQICYVYVVSIPYTRVTNDADGKEKTSNYYVSIPYTRVTNFGPTPGLKGPGHVSIPYTRVTNYLAPALPRPRWGFQSPIHGSPTLVPEIIWAEENLFQSPIHGSPTRWP